jgi:hypothetical protein
MRLPYQVGTKSRETRRRDKRVILRGRSSQGHKHDKPSLPGLHDKKSVLLTYELAVDDFNNI